MIVDNDIHILEEIIEKHGDCLKSSMCQRCPFRPTCLPRFLKPKNLRPSRLDRANMALDALARKELLGDAGD